MYIHKKERKKEERKTSKNKNKVFSCLFYEFSGLLLPFFLCLEIKLILLKTTRMLPLHEVIFILLPIPIRIKSFSGFCASTVLF